MVFNKLIPELSVANYTTSLRFYVNILGFTIEYFREHDKFAFLSYHDAQIMIEEINNHWKTGRLKYPYGRGINFQIESDDVDALVKKLQEHKYPLFRPVEENWYTVWNQQYGNKEFLVQDPDGYLLRFAQDIGIKEV